MARSRRTDPTAESRSDRRPSAGEIPPPRKRPFLLALSIVLLTGWLAFMAVMAWRG
jgi:hypothetical protein